MNLTYILLIFTVSSCFVLRKKLITITLLCITNISALLEGIIDFYGAMYIIIFYMVTHIFFTDTTNNKIKKGLLLLFIVFGVISFSFHLFDGFHNNLVLHKVTISQLSVPFSMYLNFDKVICVIILFLNSSLYDIERALNLKSISQTLVLSLGCILYLTAHGLLSKYIRFDFKIPGILPIWCLNNLFFVCFAEEVIFRGIIQRQLKLLLQYRNTQYPIPYLHLILSSAIFGLVHLKGGVLSILLASIAGLFYGITYEKTNRILCAIIIHFCLNLTHLIFFTYPMAIK